MPGNALENVLVPYYANGTAKASTSILDALGMSINIDSYQS